MVSRKTILLNIFATAWFLLSVFSSKAIDKNSLDNHIFPSCETKGNIGTKLSEGYRAFVLLPNTPINNALTAVNTFLTQNKEAIIVFIFKQSTPNLESKLKQHQIIKYLAIPEMDKLNNLAECREKEKRFFIFAPGKTSLCYPIQNYICYYTIPDNFPLEVENGFSGNIANDFVVFEIDKNHKHRTDSLNRQQELLPELFNRHTGKLPNFFVTKNLDVFFRYKKLIEQYDWYMANVIQDEKPLCGVSWKEIPEMISHGKIHTYESSLSPQKNGFRFSPDVFRFNEINSIDIKYFFATPKQLTDELALSLEFNKNINNSIDGTMKASHCNISYVKDASKGWCGLFNGESHYIDYATVIALKDNITVSAWVNPAKIDENCSILGKGEAFSVKIWDGKLLFTSPDIQDHSSDSIVVRKNEWQHLAFVFSTDKNVRFFRNGLFVGEKKITEITPTNQSLLIGTNLWDEYFEGMMDDLCIWNRALNDEEIKRVYKQNLSTGNGLGKYLVLLLCLLLLTVSIFILGYRITHNNKIKKKELLPNTKLPQIQSPQITAPYIKLFGGFQVVNREGKDLTSYFSNRRKQLFIIVLINTIRKDGINSKQLTDNLWPGHTVESAKNNKSTQTQRLRDILSQNSGINIDFNNKKWIINLHNDVYCDLKKYFDLLTQLKNEQEGTSDFNLLEQLVSIVENGAMLPNLEEEWLDKFKSKVSDELLELLLPLYENTKFMKNHRLVLRLSDALLIFDPLNEVVLKHKVKTLFQLNKNTLAFESIELFSKYYQQCYNQPFDASGFKLLNKK